jgi:hypothetical protein
MLELKTKPQTRKNLKTSVYIGQFYGSESSNTFRQMTAPTRT